jgi:excisionase family DNA binding protein
MYTRREAVAMSANGADRLLTIEEIAERLSVPPSWVAQSARDGRIPHVRLGRYVRFNWPDVEAWLVDQRAGVAPMARPRKHRPRVEA